MQYKNLMLKRSNSPYLLQLAFLREPHSLLCIKSKKLGIRLEKNICRTARGSYYNQEEWLEEFLHDKRAFYKDS